MNEEDEPCSRIQTLILSMLRMDRAVDAFSAEGVICTAEDIGASDENREGRPEAVAEMGKNCI